MSRTLALLLTITFLGAQMLSFAHVAEHSSGKDKHAKAGCEICLSVKHQDFTSPGTASGTWFLRHAQYVPQAPADVIIVCDTYNAGITRGPPLLS